MAKKRLVICKTRRKPKPAGCDQHHIFYQRKKWERGTLHELRQFDYCRVTIDKNLHELIHSKVLTVPAPRPTSAVKVLAQLKTLEGYDAIGERNTFAFRLNVLIALFDCIEPETADALRQQLDVVREFYEQPS